ncbi:MAG: DUF348 domain-containing protein [Chloroflexi bacterium]|nr:DUF348 domain-containing protein [Chloroflexota bacterium]
MLPFSFDPNLILAALVAVVLAAMAYFFVAGLVRLNVRINDQETTLWTRQQTVGGALTEAGITWNAEDIVRPAPTAPLPADGIISIRLATPIVLSADGNIIERRTQSTTVREVLAENKIELKPQDQVFLDGRLVRADAALPSSFNGAGEPALYAPTNGTVHISVTRALPITINDNGTILTLYTTENTFGTALARAGVQIYLGDSVSPDLTTPVTSGASIFIRRSRPASIAVDGRSIQTRTRADTVAKLLSQEGIQLEGKDFAVPAPTSPIIDYIAVNVTRVREEFITETEQLAFETKWLPSAELELDQRVVAQAGARGIKNRLFKSVYENGKLISTGLEREWIDHPPQDHIINYGTKVVVHDLTLPDGSVVQYWRKVRMLATAYSAATSGKDKSHPQYGRTRLGLQAGRGIVAVDPRVVNLGANVFVPGYGIALAGDTGGGIKGKRIDLGFPEDAMEDWYRWIDVYLLTPAPPKTQLNIVLPDYPVERKSSR